MTFCSTGLGGAACEMKGSNIAATRTSRFMPAILPAALTLGHHDFFGRVHEITLDELHAELPQHRHGVGVLDALGDRFDLELAGLFHELPDDGLGLEVAGEILDQRAVDLDEVERHGRE